MVVPLPGRAVSAFLFGKMPAHGDFIARGLAAEERDALDLYLSAELAAARETLGDSFEERFDSAPPWRFAWAGETWTAGAVASSVDSVGRRFPLLVGRTEVEPGAVAAMAEACEQAIYDAFDQSWTADDLAAAVDALESAESDGRPAESWWTFGGEGFDESSLSGARPAGLLTAMLGNGARAAA